MTGPFNPLIAMSHVLGAFSGLVFFVGAFALLISLFIESLGFSRLGKAERLGQEPSEKVLNTTVLAGMWKLGFMFMTVVGLVGFVVANILAKASGVPL